MSKQNNISHLLLLLFKEIGAIDTKTRKYGTDEYLFDSEIHVVQAIKDHHPIHVTALGELLGISKAAASQTVLKLEKKGMVEKIPDLSNQSRMLLHLLPKGEIAYLCHEELHKDFDELIASTYSHYTDEEKQTIQRFLEEINMTLSDFKQ